jgi:hypothetical protein
MILASALPFGISVCAVAGTLSPAANAGFDAKVDTPVSMQNIKILK